MSHTTHMEYSSIQTKYHLFVANKFVLFITPSAVYFISITMTFLTLLFSSSFWFVCTPTVSQGTMEFFFLFRVYRFNRATSFHWALRKEDNSKIYAKNIHFMYLLEYTILETLFKYTPPQPHSYSKKTH